MPKPTRSKKPQKSKYFHGAPDAVCGRAFFLLDDVSLSGDCLDWGEEYTAKVRLPEKPKLTSALRGVLSGGAR